MPDPVYEGLIRDKGGQVFNVRAFGALGDGTYRPDSGGDPTNDAEYKAIMAAIKAAGDAGGGIVYFPPTPQYYAIREAIQEYRGHPTHGTVRMDNVTLAGGGHDSCIRNVRAGTLNSELGQASVFRLGGYESHHEWLPWPRPRPTTGPEASWPLAWFQGDTFYPCYDAARGARSIGPVSSADRDVTKTWQPGDIVFIRTAQHEYYSVKEIPLACEINEVLVVDSAGTVFLRHPLSEAYPSARIARPTPDGRLDRHGLPVRVLRRFTVQGLRLEHPRHDVYSSVFTFGGLYECAFRDLWLEAGDLFMLNVMARCTVENVNGRFWGRLGEVAYLSHHNLWRNVRASYLQMDDYPHAGNGFACVEGARDNTFRDIFLNYGGLGYRPFILSARRNRLLDSTILAPGMQDQSAVAILGYGIEYKPQGCVIENCDIHLGPRADGKTAHFGIEVEAGGRFGGGCIVRGNRIHGEARFGTVGVVRYDLLNAATTDRPEGNLIEGNVHVSSVPVVDAGAVTRFEVPKVTGVVEYNNRPPAQFSDTLPQTIVDAAFRGSDNLIRDNVTRLRQERVSELDLGAFTIGGGGETAAASYLIPRNSVGTQHRWVVEASGRVTAAATGQRFVRLYLNAAQVLQITFDAAQTGAWSLRAEIGGGSTRAAFSHVDTVIGTKSVAWTTEKLVGGTATAARDFSEHAIDSNTVDTTVGLRVAAGSGGGSVTVDQWRVTPSGDEWTLLNWELVRQRWGGYY